MTNTSFFIPAYNCSKTIAEAVGSILLTNFDEGDELIIVNDSSTDDTSVKLDELKHTFPQIRVINHIRNKGGAAARNTAVENAKHELLFCLDSDNVLAPNSVAPLKSYLLEHDADVATFQHQYFFSKTLKEIDYKWTLPEGVFDLDNYFKGENTPGQHGNYLFTKKSWTAAQGYAEGCGALDTWTFGLRQAITGAKMVVLASTHYYHRLDLEHSYWMRDSEANLWSVSPKASFALFPFYNLIDERFLEYMLGPGRYKWFYTLKKKPLILVDSNSKTAFYKDLHIKLSKLVYPPNSLFKRALAKAKRTLRLQ